MATEPRYTHEQFNAKVNAVMRALMDREDGRVEGELPLDALAFVAAVIFDMHPQPYRPEPHENGRRDARLTSARLPEMAAEALRGKGVHFGELIGGETHLTGELPSGHTLQ